MESGIINRWGIGKDDLGGIRKKYPVCKPFIPNSWSPLPMGSYKVNFDGASKGNPSLVGYGGVCRDSTGVILKVYHGSIRFVTNNTAEL